MVQNATVRMQFRLKESGIDWMGKIPESWNVIRIKHSAPFKYGESLSSETRESGNFPVFGSNGIVGSHSSYNTEEPCIIVGRKGSYGKVNYSTTRCFAIDTTYYIDSTTTNCNLRWLYYCLSVLGLDINSQDIGVPGLSRSYAHNFWIPKISLPEQQAIADFLDRETARIDALIARYQRMLELLDEKRTAIINQVVRKGLDPSVPMKESGVEWIGMIPEKWKTIPLRYLLQDGKSGIKIGPFGSELKSETLSASGFKLYGQENVIANDFFVGDRYIDEIKFSEMLVYELSPEDIIISMMGTTGRCSVVPKGIQRGIIDSHLIRLRVNSEILPKYFALLIDQAKYLRNQIDNASKGAIMQGLNSSIIKSLFIALPPIDIQTQFLNYLQQKIQQDDKIRAKTVDLVNNLQEYKISIISATVTGKIDVSSFSTG